MYQRYISNVKEDFSKQLKDLSSKVPGAVGNTEVATPNIEGKRLESGTTKTDFDKFYDPKFRTGIVDNLLRQVKGVKGIYAFAVGMAADYHATLIIVEKASENAVPTFFFVEDNGGVRVFDATGLESKLTEYYRRAATYYGGAKPMAGAVQTQRTSKSMEAGIHNLENIEH